MLVEFASADSLQTAVPASVLTAFDDGGHLLCGRHQEILESVSLFIP